MCLHPILRGGDKLIYSYRELGQINLLEWIIKCGLRGFWFWKMYKYWPFFI